MRIGLKARLLLLGIDSVIITVIVLIGVAIWQTNSSLDLSNQQINTFIDENVNQITMDISNLVQSQDESLQSQVTSAMNMMGELIKTSDGLSEGSSMVTWKAKNQVSGDIADVQLPELFLGEKKLDAISDQKSNVLIVDKLSALTDVKATIFQPLPDGSGILRVASNVVTADGKRAIGTFIPAKNADGSPNAVVSAVMGKRDYMGVAFVVDAWYVSKYHPIMNSDGKVIAVLFVGKEEQSISTLRYAIQNTVVGKNGYVGILGGKGDLKGRYVIPPSASKTDQLLTDEAAPGFEEKYSEIVDKAVSLKTGETANYTVKDKDGSDRSIQVSYYAPWDWIIVVNACLSDYQPFFNDLKSNQSLMISLFVLIGIALIIINYLIIAPITRSLVKPIQTLTRASQKMSVGEIDQDITIHRSDEVGDLANAFRNMVDYLKEISATATRLASGDLTAEITLRGETDEIGHAFNTMIAEWKTAITNLQVNAVALNEESIQLTKGADQITDATAQISTTIQEISRGTIQQAESVNNSAITMTNLSQSVNLVASGSRDQASAVKEATLRVNEISTAIQEVESRANAVQVQAGKAADSASDGFKTVEGTLTGMHRIQEKVNLSVARVDEMGARSNEIGKIVETIDDIASQTNLLALNAAIEAARAGEAGKGFAVVADEVRKLAERSSGSTKEISDLVKRIQKTIQDAITAMNESSKEVESGVVQAERSGESLQQILEAAEQVKIQAGLAAKASNEIRASSTNLVESIDRVAEIVEGNTGEVEKMTINTSTSHDMVENIASISEENSAAVEEVSASTEEVSAQVSEFRNSVKSLSDMAQHLREIADKFKIAG
jgi:methyl-accepting chemotaxis protein